MLKFIERLDCTVRLLILGLLFLFVPILIANADEVSGEEEEEAETIWTPASEVLDCSEFFEGGHPGSSRENPLKIAMEDLLQESEKFNCSWVEMTVFFRWDSYYSYPAALYPSQEQYYQIHSAYSYRDKIIRLENFLGHQNPHFDYQNISLKVSGLFYDLCYEQEKQVKAFPEFGEGDWIWPFGPCHYSAVRLLKDVVILETMSEPFQYLSDESFKAKYGDLLPFKGEETDVEKIRKNSLLYISYLQSGDFEALMEALRLNEEERAKEREVLKTDPTPFMQEFFIEKSSKLLKETPIEDMENEIFVKGYRDDGVLKYDILEYAVSCFCLEETCKGKWPILSWDAESPSSTYFCVWLDRVENKNGEVDWAWWYTDED